MELRQKVVFLLITKFMERSVKDICGSGQTQHFRVLSAALCIDMVVMIIASVALVAS